MTDKQQVCERVVHTELSSLKCHNHMCLCDVMAHRRESRDTVAKEECMDVGRAASLRWMLAEKWTGRTGAFQRVPWQMWPSHVMPLLHTCYAGTSAPGGKGLFPPCAAVLPPPPRAPPKTVGGAAPPRPPAPPPAPLCPPPRKGGIMPVLWHDSNRGDYADLQQCDEGDAQGHGDVFHHGVPGWEAALGV